MNAFAPIVVSARRAAAILHRVDTARPQVGRHRAPRTRGRGVTVVYVALAVGILGAATFALTDPPPPTVAATASTMAVAEAEARFVAELAEAGITLTGPDIDTAVGIAREHVAHGHLIGMRQIIRDDFRARIPWLSDIQVDVAKVAVEHHFLAVTGRKQ